MLQEEVRDLYAKAAYDIALMRASELEEACRNHF